MAPQDVRSPPATVGDVTPQLLAANVTHAALAATYYTLYRAHPVLRVLEQSPLRGLHPLHELSSSEHLAQLVLLAADELTERLDAYAACLDSDAADDDSFSF